MRLNREKHFRMTDEEFDTLQERAAASCMTDSAYLLFYDSKNKSLITTQQVNCYFHRLCKKAGIEERGQHALRHTFATRCIEAGVPAVVLKTWLGHTDIHITLDTYADVFNRMNDDAMKKFEDYSSCIMAT